MPNSRFERYTRFKAILSDKLFHKPIELIKKELRKAADLFYNRLAYILPASPAEHVFPERQHIRQVSVQTVGGEEDALLQPLWIAMVRDHVGDHGEAPSVKVALLSKLAVVQVSCSHSTEEEVRCDVTRV